MSPSTLLLLSVFLSALVFLLQSHLSQSASLTFNMQCSSAPFSGRANGNVESLQKTVSYVNRQGGTSSAVNPLVLQGSDNPTGENDVWLSPDSGMSWFLVAGVSRTPGGPYNAPGGRADTSFKTMASGTAFTTDANSNIFRIQGQTNPLWPWEAGTCTSETWMSADGGLNWQLQGSAAPVPARKFASATSDRANNLYVLGGHECDTWATRYDVWRSNNQGRSWTQQTSQASVSGPAVGILLSVPVADGAKSRYSFGEALLYTTGWDGGVEVNQVYLSTNQGSNWMQYRTAAAFSSRDDANGEVTKDGLIIVVGGKREYNVGGNLTTDYMNDVWVSPDGGWTWGLCVEDAGFTDRRYFMTVLDQAGYLYVIGGANINQTRLNDVWRSAISFNELADVERACGITRPPCGYGIVCLPDDPTLVTLPRGVTCAASQQCGGVGPTVNHVDFTVQTSGALWSPRSSEFVGLLPQPISYINRNGGSDTSPANSFIMHGNQNYNENDVWLSTDKMVTWTLISGRSIDGFRGGGTAPGGGQSSFSLPVPHGAAYSMATYNGNNRMYRISGELSNSGACGNDVWTSTNGIQWTRIVSNSWPTRIWSSSVVSPADGSVYLFGGRGCEQGSTGSLFDVWRSADNGNSWNRQSTNFPAMGPRNGLSGIHRSPALNREIITYLSGWGGEQDYNDVVVSSDQGVTWSIVTNAATWMRRDDMAGLVTPDGVIVMVGGKTNRDGLPELFHNDIWVSMDGGYSFGRCNEDASFTDRRYMTAVLDEQGYLYVVAGQTNERTVNTYLNDAWRSTLSFTRDLASISASCNVTIPRCGPGLNCWPDSSSTQRLPGNAGVTCPACPTNAVVHPLDFVRMSGNAGWSPRAHANIELINKVVTYTPVGSTTAVSVRNALVLQGHTNGFENDVWLSSDHGATWALIAGVSVYGRTGQTRATAPADTTSYNPMPVYQAFAYDSINNYIYRMGGWNPATNLCYGGTQYSNDAKRWINVAGGTTGVINPTREHAAAITDSKGYIYVAGGRMCGTVNGLTDVWRSTDRGQRWERRTSQAPWGFRLVQLLLNVRSRNMVGNPDVLILMGGWTGGSDRNDVWASSDGGAKWELITLGAAWDSRDDMNGEVTSAGLLIVSGGKSERQEGTTRVEEIYNDVWVSADGGYTVSQATQRKHSTRPIAGESRPSM